MQNTCVNPVAKRASAASSFLVGLATFALLSACGGGGGGGTTPAVVAPPPPAPVTVGAPGVTTLNATVLQGQALQPVVLRGALTGGVESLEGRPVYVQVVDPAELFQPAALLAVERLPTGWQYSLDLRGRVLTALGQRTGALQVLACLDAACTQPLAGTPVQVPYTVNVVAGLALATDLIELSVPFGTLPAVQTVGVTLSGLSDGFVARNATPYDPNRLQSAIVAAGGAFNAAGLRVNGAENSLRQPAGPLSITLLPAPPGRVEETITVSSNVVQGPGQGSTLFERNITVRYTVTPNPALDHVFYPPRLDLTRSASDTTVAFHGYSLVAGTGLVAVLEGVDLLTRPGGANTGPVGSWLQNSASLSSAVCTSSTAPAGVGLVYSCLQPGLYTAQVRWRLQGASSSRVVAFPVTLNVTP